ncbi:uncharacterized protein LOC117167305 isoform X2 [Belonocnema kinseyi]|uniref:uncharacterized protein LOC117167305 isoform X2 n=1 Tax=Belonocnema kinseyi TaxID=2817044 RepID=UPI00143D82FF|nr:uncharacterized protein LOC117167305 isoform X2 [Belonocnema kinseyi]
MAKVLVLLVITLVCVTVNTRGQNTSEKKLVGDKFDEIVVTSDLNVRRKSKENRQGKKLLTNVQSESAGPPEKPSALTSRLESSDGSRVTLEKRDKRGIISPQERALNQEIAGYLLRSRKS